MRPPADDADATDDFPIVCVGGSAGGLDAYQRLLRSLPPDLGVAVIVSGFDGDGAAALAGIKQAGGITIAQKPETASTPDMPESAIATGWIDFILSPEQIAGKIAELAAASGQKTY